MENTDQKLKYILKLIREKRCELGYSQEFIASAIGIGQSAYSKLEQGKIPMNLTTFINIIGFLEVDFEDWFGKKHNKAERRFNQETSEIEIFSMN